MVQSDKCPEDCQREIDALQSSQARQDEQIKAQEGQISAQSAEIAGLKKSEYNPWYVKVVGIATFFGNLGSDPLVGDYTLGFDTASTGYGWGLGIGRQFGQFRVEGQFDSNKTDLDDVRVTGPGIGTEVGIGSGDIRVHTVMVNGFYDFPVADAFSLYVMAGMGYGNVTVSVYNVDDNETTFAYKAGVGASYNFAANQAIDLGYEYLGTGDVTLDRLDVNDIETHNIVLGYRYSF
jgi:opacity protein-like surface antigen